MQINFKKLVSMLVPQKLRTALVPYLEAIVFQIHVLYVTFLGKVQSYLYRMNHNGQVWSLVKLLNDRFDITQSIYIIDAEKGIKNYIFKGSENMVTWIDTELYIIGTESMEYSYDFIIVVPHTNLIWQSRALMNQFVTVVNYYKLAGKRYRIQPDTYEQAIPRPTITAIPNPPTSDTNVTFTAGNIVEGATVVFYKNNAEVQRGSSKTLAVTMSVLDDSYYVIQEKDGAISLPSIALRITGIIDPNPDPEQPIGDSYVTFANAFAGVPKETTTGTFSPHLFPNVSIPTEYNERIDNQLPNYIVMINNDELSQFAANGTTPYQKGIWSWRNNQFQPCVDFWDNCAGVSNEEFVSPRPFNQRYDLFLMNAFNFDGLDADTYFRTKTIQESYNTGQIFGGPFGLGDSPDGFRTRRAVHESDVEIGLVVGEELEPSKRLAAFYAGIADRSLGIVLAQYMSAFFTFGYTAEGRYPDQSGNYPSRTFPRNDGTGLTFSITQYWWEQFQIGGQSKYITDYENLYMVEEITFPSEDSWKQGKLVYSPSGQYLRKVNHFGEVYDLSGQNGHNVDHVLSRATSLIETDVYINKKRNKASIQMLKIVCDRLGVGNGVWRWLDTQEFNQYGNRAVLAHSREIAFMAIVMQFMSGSKGNLFWGSPQADSPADGYNAIFAGNVIFNKPVTLNGQSISLASLRNQLTFLQWNSEQSYDGGNTWVKHKALEWKNSQGYLPLRLAYTSQGQIVVFACRPYDVEPTTIKYRVQIGSSTYIGEITANEWQSCYPVEEPTRKDYHLKIIKIPVSGVA